MTSTGTDTVAVYELLRERGSAGVHTSEIRRRGLSGNPSQRATEIEERFGVTIERRPERWTDPSGKTRNGARFTLLDTPTGEAGGNPAPPAGPAVGPAGDSHRRIGPDGGESPAPAPDAHAEGQDGEGTLFSTAEIDIPPVRPTYLDPDLEEAA